MICHTWQEINLSYLFGQRSYTDFPVQGSHHTWQELNKSFHSLFSLGWKFMYNSFLANNLKQTYLYILGMNLLNHSILTYDLRQSSNLVTHGRNLMYHSILAYAIRRTNLYMSFDLTWQELNLSFHSDLCS